MKIIKLLISMPFISSCAANSYSSCIGNQLWQTEGNYIKVYVQKKISKNNNTSSNDVGGSVNSKNLVIINESSRDVRIGTVELPKNTAIDFSEPEYRSVISKITKDDLKSILGNDLLLKKNNEIWFIKNK
jgi:hypothetical protein